MSIEEVRRNIDRIDRLVVELLSERGDFVSQAARFKNSEDDVKAPRRVEQVYRTMISGFIEEELSEHRARMADEQPERSAEGQSDPDSDVRERPESPLCFESERLLFRTFYESDTDAVHGYASDPFVTRMTYWGPYTRSETESFLRRALRNAAEIPRSFYDLAIVSKERGPLSPPVGGCKIHVADRENREAEIGYYLEQKSWNRGFATETARTLLSFGFSHLRLHRMVALCFVENQRSAHVLEKIGMTQDGILRKHRLKEGRWVDSFLYSILDSEWESRQENGNGKTSGEVLP